MQTIIVTGASGFVGNHLINHLASQYPILRILNADILSPVVGSDRSGWVACDIRKSINLPLKGTVDCIINLAAVHKSPGHPSHEYFETNILGARNICDFADRVGCKKIIFTSSIAVYGPGEDEKTEESLPMPVIPYGISKTIAEYIHREWLLRDNTRQLAILRPAVIFGRGEKGNFTRMATALRKGFFVYPGRKDAIKSCVYVKDVIRCITWLMERNEREAVFNICYPQKITTRDVAQAFHTALGYKVPKTVIPQGMINSAASVLRLIDTPFIRSLGLDPVRIAKLVNSTNISSQKLVGSGFEFSYDVPTAIADWAKECGGEKLF